MTVYFVITGLVIIAGFVFASVTLTWALNEDTIVMMMVAFLMGVVLLIGTIGFFVAGADAIGAEHRAKALNAALGTEFTAEEVFWAGDEISKIYYGELQRFNVNINGDSISLPGGQR